MKLKELLEFVRPKGPDWEGDDPLRRKLSKVISDLPGAFKKQASLEKAVDDRLALIAKTVDGEFDRKDPALDKLVHHYQPTASVVDMVLWNVPDNNDAGEAAREQARAYVKTHYDKLLSSLEAHKAALEELAADADSEDWPTGKGSLKYTRYNYAWHDVTSSISALKRLKASNFTKWGY